MVPLGADVAGRTFVATIRLQLHVMMTSSRQQIDSSSNLVCSGGYRSVVSLYAAYAGNLDPAQMILRTPHSPCSGTGWLNGWRLTFGGHEPAAEGPTAMIVQDDSSAVYVALYDLTEHDEAQLDEWEQSDLTSRDKIRCRIDTLNGQVLAWTYVIDAYEDALPSATYLGFLLDAAEAAGAPEDYLRGLREHPCR